MNLAPPPMWESLLLESPLPVVIALVAMAVVLRVMASRRRDRRLNYAALGALAAAMLVFVLAHLVVTDREAIMARTEALVAATAPLDSNALADLIANGATVTGPQGQPFLDYSQLRPELERTLTRFPVEGQAVRSLAAQAMGAPGTRGESIVGLSTQVRTEFFGGPIRSEWGLFWQKESDGEWRVVEIRWLTFQGQEPTNLMWR